VLTPEILPVPITASWKDCAICGVKSSCDTLSVTPVTSLPIANVTAPELSFTY